jgi:hypothetical protein
MNRDSLGSPFGDQRGFSYRDLAAFAIPMTQAIKLQMVGILYLPEILFVILLPILLFSNHKLLSSRQLRMGLLLLAAGLLGAIFSDAAGTSTLDDIARGWMKIIVFGATICSIYLLIRDDLRRLIFVYVAGAIGTILELWLNPGDLAVLSDYDPWKFGVGNSVTILTLFLVTILFQQNIFTRFWGAAIIIAISLVSLALDCRSLFGLTFITGMLEGSKVILDMTNTGRRRLSLSRFSIFLLFGLSFAAGSMFLYSFAAGNGWLGAAAEDKFVHQAEGDVNILAGGRPEFLVSLQAIIDSPIIGHGSWAQDPYYVLMYIEILKSKGLLAPNATGPEDQVLIPTHSHLFGAWVEWGILGALFWIWLLTMCFRSVYALVNIRDPRMCIYVFMLISLIWDVLFSPFGAFMRLVDAPKICLVMMIVRKEKKGPLLERPGLRLIEGV